MPRPSAPILASWFSSFKKCSATGTESTDHLDIQTQRLPKNNFKKCINYDEHNDNSNCDDSNVPIAQAPDRPRLPAYQVYLIRASRLLAREMRQRSRLSFIAAASLPSADSEQTDASKQSLLHSRAFLSREKSKRAKDRRSRAQVY
ncbi:unnamed protein product [Protopolystoma xenopodis]|uniref:Uncharacterized protein n=1 Tax=Protopolystoma xenopodis TaxID=117903 RepID=A0A3S5AIW6_9PLAT|nr:unnamed protein product [Protopolystoma xenopodis]